MNGDYIEIKLKVNVLAKAKIDKYTNCTEIVSFTGLVDCIKHEMYDSYEYGDLDVSEYDYDINNVEPIEYYEFNTINAHGNKVENKNFKIENILEVFGYEIEEEIY